MTDLHSIGPDHWHVVDDRKHLVHVFCDPAYRISSEYQTLEYVCSVPRGNVQYSRLIIFNDLNEVSLLMSAKEQSVFYCVVRTVKPDGERHYETVVPLTEEGRSCTNWQVFLTGVNQEVMKELVQTIALQQVGFQ